MYEEVSKLWDEVVELGIATDEEISLVTYINGFNVESINDIIYVRTGYRSLEQLKECEQL